MSESERVKITENVRKYAAEQGLSEQQAVNSGMQQKALEFAGGGAEIYAKVQP